MAAHGSTAKQSSRSTDTRSRWTDETRKAANLADGSEPSPPGEDTERGCYEPIRSRDRQSAWPEESEDMPSEAENPDDYVDPAIAPLIEAGEGESEGFDVAEADLIRHAEHGDEHGTDRIWRDAAGFRAGEIPGLDDSRYGAADDEDPET